MPLRSTEQNLPGSFPHLLFQTFPGALACGYPSLKYFVSWPRRGSEFVDSKLEEGASELKLGER